MKTKKTRPPFIVPTAGRSHAEIRADVIGLRSTDRGVICPCCDKLAHVWRRTITASMARFLIEMMRKHDEIGPGYLYVSSSKEGDLRPPGGDYAKMRWWGLIEQSDGERDDGSKRNGHWRITDYGRKFARGQVTIRKYLYEYANRIVDDLPGSNKSTISIQQACGKNFDVRDIYPGVWAGMREPSTPDEQVISADSI